MEMGARENNASCVILCELNLGFQAYGSGASTFPSVVMLVCACIRMRRGPTTSERLQGLQGIETGDSAYCMKISFPTLRYKDVGAVPYSGSTHKLHPIRGLHFNLPINRP